MRVRIKVKTFFRDHYSAAREQIQHPNAARKLKILPTPCLHENTKLFFELKEKHDLLQTWYYAISTLIDAALNTKLTLNWLFISFFRISNKEICRLINLS